ncbi:adenine nucleotide alpha hydrolase [uncultured Cohaesibacter sp.]|uniref:adenine nucleotide alpha hydrolase n=1 Tax=uncultured Cohaesibacter sp. TaxID=1002546 RepID=UPI0029C879CF|nr:adenine nucleotide alpha hydrolase [uncultured Cohaesibacter sp.]
MNPELDRLASVFDALPMLTIAVSGGVDSLTLAHAARWLGKDFAAVHAVSPAVPASATERVKRHAEAGQWQLSIIEAGEFADENYLKNPVNRCYFCKTNLYGRIREIITEGRIASGTNLDDLGDFRPGLQAAEEIGVVHPFVLAQLCKEDVRAIARFLKLEDIAELAAQPCLASRIETGIGISASDLIFVDKVERIVRGSLPDADIRCRITSKGVQLQASQEVAGELVEQIAAQCRAEDRDWLGVAHYQRGSAFKHDPGE